MDIYTVRDNLKNTIAGKEALLAGLKDTSDVNDRASRMAIDVSRNFLEVNIDELKKILADVEVCCTKAVEASWAISEDRMGK